MATKLKTLYGFTSGEMSPDFYGRTDISKYDFGLRTLENFYVDFRGGVKTRGGFRFTAPVAAAAPSVKHHFKATTDDYVLEFTALLMRPMRYGQYLLEAAKSVTSVTGAVFTSASHGYAVGDVVFISAVSSFASRYFRVGAATTNTFTLTHVDGAALSTTGYPAYVSGGTVARTVAVVTPFAEADLPALRAEQKYDEVVLTHPLHEPRKLSYINDTTWTLGKVVFGSKATSPTGLSLSLSHSGAAGAMFCVTAVVEGEESAPCAAELTEVSCNYSIVEGQITLTWNAVAGAEEYRIYRSLLLPVGANISRSLVMGYIGYSLGPQFTDNNITPDFTITPPLAYNPFAPSPITEIVVTAGGTGYTNASAVTVTDASGTGFRGFPVVVGGVLRSIVVENGGANYASPSVSVSGGSGATFTTTLGTSEGIFPSLCKIVQQRAVYAGSLKEPMRLWGSRPAQLDNFDVSYNVTAADAYSYELDSREVEPIRHLVALRSGLLAFTDETITLLRAEDGKALNALSALAEPQAYKGCGAAEPITDNLDVIFAQSSSSSINAMQYTEYTNSFVLQDLALLSNHLFGVGRKVVRMALHSEPSRIIWLLREDGTLVSLTYERAQEVSGWARHVTQGKFVDICTVREGEITVLYATVLRYLQGRWQYLNERFTFQEVREAEDYFGVDAGLSRNLTAPAATLTLVKNSPTQYALTSAAWSGTPTAGDVVFAAQGRFRVVSFSTGTAVCAVVRVPSELMHVTGLPYVVAAGAWEWATPVEEVGGLWHLEGETVSLCGDGDGVTGLVVSGGKLALPAAYVKAHVGLQYVASSATLPVSFTQDSAEALRKTINKASVRLLRTRGLALGSASAQYEIKTVAPNNYDVPLGLRDDLPAMFTAAKWDELGSIYFSQSYPLPAHVLSFHYEMEVAI